MSFYFVGHSDAAAGTEITAVCPPNGSMIPVLRGFQYRTAATPHNLYVMKSLGVTTVDGGVAAAGTTITVAKVDPGKSTAAEDETLATGDWVVVKTRYGSLEAKEVTGVSGNDLTVAAVDEPIDDGASLWAFYEPGRSVHKQFDLAATSTTHKFESLHIQGGIPYQDGIEITVPGSGAPLLVVADNVTNAGDLDWVSFEWVDQSNEFIQ